jgi:hypothetical protein
MMLGDLLARQRSTILDRWRERIFDGYPADTSRFLRREKDRFCNPVGQAISEATAQLLDRLCGNGGPQGLPPAAEELLKIRSVQTFTPGAALSFIFTLKEVVRAEAAGEGGCPEAELVEFESRVDRLALELFEGFVHIRELIYEIRANDVRRMSQRLLDRMNLRPPEEGPPDGVGTERGGGEETEGGDDR